jgi:hypothetical protein
METVTIDILNPKAKSLLKDLADLNLIRFKKEKVKSEFKDLLEKLRINSDEALSLEEITSEVEAVRKARYEK